MGIPVSCSYLCCANCGTGFKKKVNLRVHNLNHHEPIPGQLPDNLRLWETGQWHLRGLSHWHHQTRLRGLLHLPGPLPLLSPPDHLCPLQGKVQGPVWVQPPSSTGVQSSGNSLRPRREQWPDSPTLTYALILLHCFIFHVTKSVLL